MQPRMQTLSLLRASEPLWFHEVRTVLKYLWAFPTTAVGLLFVPLAIMTRGQWQVVGNVIEINGGAVQWFLRACVPIAGGASAMTLGHVVLGTDRHTLDRTREHERVHVRQVERWGPLFIPAYFLAGAWQWFRGRNPYRDNPFERAAREETQPRT